MDKIILIGGGGHCGSVIDVVEESKLYEIIGILDPFIEKGTMVFGYPILGDDDVLKELYSSGIKKAFITLGSVGNSVVRERIFEQVRAIGYELPTIISKSAIVSSKIIMETGAFIGKQCVINRGCRIGCNCIVNTGAILEHDCTIEAFTHVSTGAVLCGNVSVGNRTHIGANATVIQDISIGNHVMIGAGSVVVKDINNNEVAYGNPCRVKR